MRNEPLHVERQTFARTPCPAWRCATLIRIAVRTVAVPREAAMAARRPVMTA